MGGKHHGYSQTDEYRIWKAVKNRCNNPKTKAFKNYGGKGIKMVPAWERSFPAFLEHVGKRPTPQHTIERKDSNLGYQPGNVVWATRLEQNRNRPRKQRLVTANGKTQPLWKWAEETGLASSTIRRRLHRGWSEQRSVTTPLM